MPALVTPIREIVFRVCVCVACVRAGGRACVRAGGRGEARRGEAKLRVREMIVPVVRRSEFGSGAPAARALANGVPRVSLCVSKWCSCVANVVQLRSVRLSESSVCVAVWFLFVFHAA